MRRILFAIALLGLCYLLFVQIPSLKLTPFPLDFEGAAGVQLSPRGVNLLAQVKRSAIALVDQQRSWQRVAIGLGFLGLAATAVATLVAAWKRKESQENREEFLNKKISVIGALTAVATLAASSSDLLDKTIVKPLDGRIATLSKALADVPAEIAVSPERQESLLDSLEILLRSNAG